MTEEECLTRLGQARDALHRVAMGESVQVVSHDGRTVTYVAANIGRLSAYVRLLEAQCGEGVIAGQCRGRARVVRWHR